MTVPFIHRQTERPYDIGAISERDYSLDIAFGRSVTKLNPTASGVFSAYNHLYSSWQCINVQLQEEASIRQQHLVCILYLLLEGKWRFRRCCCFSLQTGTNIFAILTVLGGIINIYIILSYFDDAGRFTSSNKYLQEQMRESIPFAVTKTTKGITCTLAAISIVVGLALGYGNTNGIKKAMVPFLYLQVVEGVMYEIGYFIKMIAYFNNGNLSGGFQTILQLILLPVLLLLVCQVVRCRMVEIDETQRPAIPFTQIYPNAPPAYGQTKSSEEQQGLS